MRPTDVLVQEHEAILKMLKILNIICDKMASGEQVNSEHLEQIVDFIKNFADKCHHGKEEDILFESMVKVGFLKEAGPISVMLSEHNTGRDLVKGLSEAVELYKQGDSSTVPAIIGNARKYSGLLTQHIDKENNILYPMAENHLTREQLDRMSEEFEKFELEQMGEGKHEEFHTIIKNLSAVYLK